MAIVVGIKATVPVSDFGHSSATYMIKVKIDGSKHESQNPAAQLEEGEFIESFWVPLNDLYAQCRKLEAEGFAIDGKVGSLAEGIEMSKMSRTW